MKIDVDKEHGRILDLLKNKKIDRLNEFKIEKLLFNQIYMGLTRSKSFLFATIISSVLFDRESIKVYGDYPDLLLFSEMFNRRDFDSYWKCFIELFDEKTCFEIYNINKNNVFQCFSLKKILYKIKALRYYSKALKDIKSCFLRLFLSAQLVWFEQFYIKLSIINPKPKVAVCFCDALFQESLMIQWLKNRGVLTVTNQHGQPLLRDSSVDRLNQSQILNFNSDYFLAKGLFTAKQFIKNGINGDEIVVVGDLNSHTFYYRNKPEQNHFCVFLDTPSYPFYAKTNTELLEFANEISKRFGLKYYIKYHPSDKGHQYVEHLDNSIVVDKNMSLDELFALIDFGLFSASAIYIDMISKGIKAFQYTHEVFPITEIEEDIVHSMDDFDKKINAWKMMNEKSREEHFRKIYKMYYMECYTPVEIKRFILSKIKEKTYENSGTGSSKT